MPRERRITYELINIWQAGLRARWRLPDTRPGNITLQNKNWRPKFYDSPPMVQEQRPRLPQGIKSIGSSIVAWPPREKRRATSFLRGQAVHEHFSIEASAVATPVRMTVSPLRFLTRIDAPSPRLIRRARASTWHQIARSSGSVMTSAMKGVSPCRIISNVNADIQYPSVLQTTSGGCVMRRNLVSRHLAVQHGLAVSQVHGLQA